MARSTPAVNVRLLEVREAGGTDTFEAGATEGALKWEGDVGAWLEELRQRRSTPDPNVASDVYVLRDLTVMSDNPIDWTEGDTVSFRRVRGGDPISGRVRVVDLPDPPMGVPGEVRLTLELG